MKKYMTTAQAAKKWNISARRVRILCQDNRIKGSIKKGRAYLIPDETLKPIDQRIKVDPSLRYLKWSNDIIATINVTNEVFFIEPKYNTVVAMYSNGQNAWTSEQFLEFINERIVSRDRRDIEKILFRLGLSVFDVFKIASATRAIHPKDLLWIAHNKDEKFEDVMSDVFASVFTTKIDASGDSVDTPEGYNIKRYGVYNGKYGIYKQRINPLTTDVESEIAVFLLAKKLGIACCPAYKVDKDTMFSEFKFDFAKDSIVHFRRLFDGVRGENEYQNLIGVRPQYEDDIAKLIIIDFITRQDDRHLSNIAIKISSGGETFYPLYDNGRSLFYEDTEDFVNQAVNNPNDYATGFGYVGTYLDYVKEIVKRRGSLGDLVNLDVTKDEVDDILKQAEFSGYRLVGATKWIMWALSTLKQIDQDLSATKSP